MATVSGPSSTGNYEVVLTGPLFDGSITRLMRTCLTHIEDDVGDLAVETVRGIDDVTFRHPTGHARSMTMASRVSGQVTVNRQGLVYGPWLEFGGRGGFRGYHAFEKAAREVDAQVPAIVERNLQEFVIR